MLENINNSNKVFFILVFDFYIVYIVYIVLKKYSVALFGVLKRGRLNALKQYNEMV